MNQQREWTYTWRSSSLHRHRESFYLILNLITLSWDFTNDCHGIFLKMQAATGWIKIKWIQPIWYGPLTWWVAKESLSLQLGYDEMFFFLMLIYVRLLTFRILKIWIFWVVKCFVSILSDCLQRRYPQIHWFVSWFIIVLLVEMTMKIPVYRYTHFQPHPPEKKKKTFEGLLRPQLWWFELLWIPGWTHNIPAWWVLYANKIVFQSYMVINCDHDLNLLSGLCFNGWYVSGIGIVSSKPWFFPAKLGGKSSPLQFVGSADPVPRLCDDGGDAARGNVLIVSGQAKKKKGPFRGEVAKNNWNRDEHGAVFHGVSYVVTTSGKHNLKHVELQHSHTAAGLFILSISWIISQFSSNYT